MSDRIEDLVRLYENTVFHAKHPRSIGLFPIPEYPEYEVDGGMWSTALEVLLTTLRFLAPATLLTLFWGQQSFLFKILKSIDSAFRSIVFSSEEQKQSVLQWLAETGAVRVEHLDTVWRHGWILCGVLDAAMPGACAGHPPTRLSLKHAQAIAEHYLGVEPVFTRQELESNDSLSRHQEWKLATYIDRIRQALSKLTPPVSKPVSQRTSPEITQFTLDYVAKGSGLAGAQLHNKAQFKIYPTGQQSLDPGEITILIRGPKDTYGMAVLPPILGKAQMIRQKLLGLQSKQNYTENILPITQGATYMRTYGKNDMNKTYYIPKAKYDIEIEMDVRTDHAKISYVVNLEGKYLVSITSRGQNIAGSPFTVTGSHNIISVLERDSFCLEDGEEIDIVDIKGDRKVVLRIVDFVTEKMLLKENGTLERISDEEAKLLMMNDNDKVKAHQGSNKTDKTLDDNTIYDYIKPANTKKMYHTAKKVRTLHRVCKIFNDLRVEKELRSTIKERYKNPRNHKDIPDIVNSTFLESNIKPYILPEIREKYIVPENISVSLKSEKSYVSDDDRYVFSDKEVRKIQRDIVDGDKNNDQLDKSNNENYFAIDQTKISITNNPFLNDIILDEKFNEKNYAYVASEYETHNSQSEEITDSPIKIIIDRNISASPTNPFIEIEYVDNEDDPVNVVRPETAEIERPKTPVYKIIAGEKLNRDEPIFIDPKMELAFEESLGNKFTNPFFMHHHSTHYQENPVTDFIIGAPVSLPPVLRSISPEPGMTSLVADKNIKENVHTLRNEDGAVKDGTETEFSTPLHTFQDSRKTKIDNNSAISSTFHSLESNLTENIDIASTSDDRSEPYNIGSRDSSPRKDIWDSAYVSIDDNNSSPDSNNNENTILYEMNSKKGSTINDKFEITQEVINMGPAERELWQTCSELSDVTKPHDEAKSCKWERKRPTFTPIIEESDRSLSSGVAKIETCPKESTADSVSVAFAELNDMYQEYFPDSESSSTSAVDEDDKLHNMDVEFVTKTKDTRVYSASELADVKRHETKLEGMISGVQANVTESVSVSQILPKDSDTAPKNNKNDKGVKQFSKINQSNIVLEKKKYWDERIRQIEAKTAETPVLQKKKRTPSKQLKHDSLSKRRGKQMIKNFLNSGDYNQVISINQEEEKVPKVQQERRNSSQNTAVPDNIPQAKADAHLVEKWKKYWDEKLEAEIALQSETHYGTRSPLKNTTTPSPTPPAQKSQTPTTPRKFENQIENKKIVTHSEIHIPSSNKQPVKHELPEEVFKAFETSPKRFFGTSRKHILNKIDTFLGKPATTETSTTGLPGACHETGLVSSRISLFHNLTNTEELPWARKSQSLQNLTPRRDDTAIKSDERHSKPSTISHTNIPKNSESQINEATNQIISETVNLKNKRARMIQTLYNKTFDDTIHENDSTRHTSAEPEIKSKTDKHRNVLIEDKLLRLRKKSFSKSEMDIFNKAPSDSSDDYLDKYKSFDELPKLNVKNVISLYESVSNTNVNINSQRMQRNRSEDSQRPFLSNSIKSDAVRKLHTSNYDEENPSNRESFRSIARANETNQSYLWKSKETETSNLSLDTNDSVDIEVISDDKTNTQTTYVTLSDLELEIVESCPNSSKESTPEYPEPAHIEYKNRFKMAKQFFQSLEELREEKRPQKYNECELLLRKSAEPAETERPQKRVKKNVKSHSLPSSEISKIWSQLQESQKNSTDTKLVKISEKFHVEDLFSDVTEGKLSRQGSLRGIPNKKAVLETFRSMENLSDSKMSSYDIADSQLTNFTEASKGTNAQTYLKEYPYLPTTDPSKSHSRLDAKASGLITLSELKERKRRNSVPELRLNTSFTENL